MKNYPLLHKLMLTLLLSWMASTASAASKSDLAKEKRWEAQIVDSLLVGEAIKLNANNVEFLGLYAEPTTEKVKGAVILLHGMGGHPAWPDVIDPLRMQLPELGWHTLSLQMPILGNEATAKDYPPLLLEVPARIQAGVNYLKIKGINNIVLSGHSIGATMASFYLSTHRDPAVKTFAILSGGFGVLKDKLMDSINHFRNIKGVNIFDIYGSEDLKPVLEVIGIRSSLGKKLHKDHYRLIKVHGANHFYRDKQEELIKVLNTELSKTE